MLNESLKKKQVNKQKKLINPQKPKRQQKLKKKKQLNKIVLPELDIYDCYIGDKYVYTELDFSSNHTIIKKNAIFKKIVAKLRKTFYLKVDKQYASILIYPHGNKNLHDVIDSFNINKISGIKFLNANYIPHTCVIFKYIKNQVLANIFLCENNHTHTKLYFNNYYNIPKIQEDIAKLQEIYLYDVNLLIDRIIRYKSNY